MIRIITSDHKELDLSTDVEFQLEMENPMFDTERYIAPFTTSIQLPASDSNKEILGYLPVAMMPPSVKTLDVVILDGETLLTSGTLNFESIAENGELEYQFVGKKISSGSTGLRDRIGGYRGTKLYPLLVKKGHIGYSEYTNPNNPNDKEPDNNKFLNKNIPTGGHNAGQGGIPCLKITTILSSLGFQDTKSSVFGQAAVLSFDNETTVLDFLKDTCKLFCCILYDKSNGAGGRYVEIKDINDILDQTLYKDWSKKVSDVFSSTVEPGRGYKLNYANERPVSEGVGEAIESGTYWGSFETLGGDYYYRDQYGYLRGGGLHRVRAWGNDTPYRALRILTQSEPRDYSVKANTVNVTNEVTGEIEGTTREVLCDFLGFVSKEEVNSSVNGEQLDASVSFKLVECTIIEKILSVGSWSSGAFDPGDNYYLLTPRVEDSDNKGVLIGNLYTASGNSRAQLVDDIIAGNDSHNFTEFATSLSPMAVFNRLHTRFAAWLEEDRQVVDTDINLTAEEIASFNIWEKVMFANTFWLCKKLTITITKEGISGCRGEFIEF